MPSIRKFVYLTCVDAYKIISVSLCDHRLYTPYGCETHKRHWLYAGFAPLL